MTTYAGDRLAEPLRLHFLVFAPRSGSTLFTQSMSDTCPGTMIVPEFRTAEYLLARSERRVRHLNAHSLLRVLEADRQLMTNLGITNEAAVALARRLAGSGTLEILTAIISTYAQDAAPSQDVVLKLGGAAEFMARLQEVSPTGTVVHVYRDGRASVSSLLKTPKAYFPAENMGGSDVAYCCAVWLRHQRTLRKATGGSYPVIPVRYEAFVQDGQKVCRTIATAMRLGDGRNGMVRAFSISGAESALHPLVTSPASLERQTAWRAEMSRRAQVFADWRMQNELNRLGYGDRVLPRPGRSELGVCTAATYAHHARVLTRYTLARSRAYLGQPAAVVEHVNARLARIVSRRRRGS